MELNTVNLLGRVDSRIDKVDLIKEIVANFNLGRVRRLRQIHEGFEDFNVKLETTLGKFLIKIFSQYKSFRQVKDNVFGLVRFGELGVATPKVLKNGLGDYLFYYERNSTSALACVMEYFEGKSFWRWGREPIVEEIKDIVEDIVKINLSGFKPTGVYDVWGTVNLPYEFEKKKMFLATKEKIMTKKIVEEMGKIDWSRLRKGTIHADLQRSNILRNADGEIRIIDFSVMQWGAVSVELAVFLALFVINPKLTKNRTEIEGLIDLVVDEYRKYSKLGKYDVQVLPILIEATYAINHLAAVYEWKVKGNKTPETKYWIELGRRGMRLVGSGGAVLD